MSKSKSLSLPDPSTPTNPNAAPEGRNHRKPQSAERGTRPAGGTVAERLPAMSAAAPTRSATMSKPSMEAEPMRGRTSTPAAGRQGTGKGGVKRRAILRPGFSLAMKFLSLAIYDFALYRGKVYRTFAAK